MFKPPMPPVDYILERIEKNYFVHQGTVYRIKDGYIGTINKDGHRQFKIGISSGQMTIASHHMAYFLHYKKWPEQQLDHFDRDKLNNDPDNLRYSNNHVNAGNKPRVMGHLPPGVKLKKSGYYEAYIRHEGKTIFCGSRKTAYEAFQCYREMYQEIYGEEYPELGGGGLEDF